MSLRLGGGYLSLPKRRVAKNENMLFVVLGSALAAVLSVAIVKRRQVSFVLDVLFMHAKYDYIAVKDIFWQYAQASSNTTELPKMTGKVAIVTGGSRGMGLDIVRMLLQCDLEVIIACRNTAAGEKAAESIRKRGITSGKAKVMRLDNSSLDSVRKFVEEFKNNYQKLDILVNNAGIMFTPYGETKDGFENQYAVNYLSHFLLTVSLIPLLNNAGTADSSARIVNMTSVAHLLGDIDFDDINHKKSFVTGSAYAQSKVAQHLFTKSLTRLFEKKKLHIIVNSVHPGVVATDLFDHCYLKHAKLLNRLFMKTPEQGATVPVFAAVSPRMEGKSGLYLVNCLEWPANSITNDQILQDKLFELSMKQVQLQNVAV